MANGGQDLIKCELIQVKNMDPARLLNELKQRSDRFQALQYLQTPAKTPRSFCNSTSERLPEHNSFTINVSAVAIAGQDYMPGRFAPWKNHTGDKNIKYG